MSEPGSNPTPDPTRSQAVGAAFGAAAEGYARNAPLQHRVATELAKRIAALPLPEHPTILEIGCGTGFLTLELRARLPGARWLISDLAPTMVAQCRSNIGLANLGRPGLEHTRLAQAEATDAPPHFLVMDGERPCLSPASRETGFDLICASLALQWFTAPAQTLAAWSALLRPGGHIAFATLAEGTFAQWRAAHSALGLSAGVPDYPAPRRIAQWWPNTGTGWLEPVEERETYPDGHTFLKVLKGIGAHLPAPGHRPLAPGALRRVLRRWSGAEELAISYQVVYGMFRKTGAEQPGKE